MAPVFRADFRPCRLASRTGAGRPCRPPCVGCSPAAAGRLLLEAEGHARGDVHVSAVGGSGPEAAVASERVVDAGAEARVESLRDIVPAVSEQRVRVDLDRARVVADAGSGPGEQVVERVAGDERAGGGEADVVAEDRPVVVGRSPCSLTLPAFIRSYCNPRIGSGGSGVWAGPGAAASVSSAPTSPALTKIAALARTLRRAGRAPAPGPDAQNDSESLNNHLADAA